MGRCTTGELARSGFVAFAAAAPIEQGRRAGAGANDGSAHRHDPVSRGNCESTPPRAARLPATLTPAWRSPSPEPRVARS